MRIRPARAPFPRFRGLIGSGLSILLLLCGCGGALVVFYLSNGGAAPGDGQLTYDTPGCGPNRYDGPDRRRHFLLHLYCLPPKPVIISHSNHEGHVWNVALDGSRSFDPQGSRVISYLWTTERGVKLKASEVKLVYSEPGDHKVRLMVTDENDVVGNAVYTVRLR